MRIRARPASEDVVSITTIFREQGQRVPSLAPGFDRLLIAGGAGKMPSRQPLAFICDDDRMTATALANGLAGDGFLSESFATAEACLSRAAIQQPPFVILEPNLPSRSWYRFLHEMVKCLPRTSRIVVLTAYPSAAMASEAEQIGVSSFLAKPASLATILAALRGAGTSKYDPSATASRRLATVEWEHINQVICACRGNMSVAARELGLPRQTLYAKLRKLPSIPVRAPLVSTLKVAHSPG